MGKIVITGIRTRKGAAFVVTGDMLLAPNGTCTSCRRPVWLSFEQQHHALAGLPVVCVWCAVALFGLNAATMRKDLTSCQLG